MQAKKKAALGERCSIRALIAGSLVLVGAAASVETVFIDEVRLPPNLAADTPMFHPTLAHMWQSSRTFRRQCARIAAAEQLTVTLFADAKGTLVAPARTIIRHRDGRPVTAHVFLRPTFKTVQLIAHEMEHIIEQLDGVDLRAQAGGPNVWADPGGFETIRAVEMGRRVEREVTEASRAGRPHYSAIDAPAATGPALTTIVQQNSRSAEDDPRAGRVSGNGRYVVFTSFAPLVPTDRNGVRDVYVMDLWTRQVTLESQGSNSTAADGESHLADISHEGRFVVFESLAGNLLDWTVPPGFSRVFLRDRETGAIRLISTTADDESANGHSGNPVISADGSTVVFASGATNLSGGCRSSGRRLSRLYLVRVSDGQCLRVDVSSAGLQGDQESTTPSVSGDGRYVAFMSRADLTCRGDRGCHDSIADRNGVADVYVRDFGTQVIVRVSRGLAGADPDGASYQPAISSDGHHVVFVSEATNLVARIRTRVPQVYIHDMTTGITELVSHTSRGRPGNGASLWPTVSGDGVRIAFQSRASDLVCENECPPDERDINLLSDVFTYDRTTRAPIRVSADGRDQWMEYSRAPSLDARGCVVAFASPHPIDERDHDYDEDVYVGLLAGWSVREPPSNEEDSDEAHRLLSHGIVRHAPFCSSVDGLRFDT